MHDTLICLKSIYKAEDKPTPEDVRKFIGFGCYLDSVSRFNDEDIRELKLKSAGYAVESLGQEVEDRRFEFNKCVFEEMAYDQADDYGLIDFFDDSSRNEKFRKAIDKVGVAFPVAYEGRIYKNLLTVMNNVLKDSLVYEIVDVYDVHF